MTKEAYVHMGIPKNEANTDGVLMTTELIDAFIEDLKTRGRTEETCNIYRRKLTMCQVMLEDKTIRAGTLLELRTQLQELNVSNGGINLFVSSINTFLDYCGKHELQVKKSLEPTNVQQPELTRSEYLKLLNAAKKLKNERAYMLVKLFVNTGINVRELPLVTLEAVNDGSIELPERKSVHISPCLCEELRDFCGKCGVLSGSVFVNSNGVCLSRSAINNEIRRLSPYANVAEEKCNPMTLRRLYLKTQEDIMESLSQIIDHSLDRLFDTEQMTVAWES